MARPWPGLTPPISLGKAPPRFYSTMIEAAPVEAEKFETEPNRPSRFAPELSIH
jgi:hypothetical protein